MARNVIVTAGMRITDDMSLNEIDEHFKKVVESLNKYTESEVAQFIVSNFYGTKRFDKKKARWRKGVYKIKAKIKFEFVDETPEDWIKEADK